MNTCIYMYIMSHYFLPKVFFFTDWLYTKVKKFEDWTFNMHLKDKVIKQREVS